MEDQIVVTGLYCTWINGNVTVKQQEILQVG